MVVMTAAGLAVVAILLEAMAYAGGYARGEDREGMSMYLLGILMAFFVLALATLAGVGAFPETLMGPDWMSWAALPFATLLATVAIIAACLPDKTTRMAVPDRWATLGAAGTCLALLALSFGI